MSSPASHRRLGGDLAWNMVSLGFLAIAGLTLNFVIGRYYDPSVLGVFNQVLAFYLIFSQLAVGGFCFSVLAAMPIHPEERRQVLTAALLLTCLLAAVIALLLAFLARPLAAWLDSPSVAIGLWCAAPGVFFFALNKIFLFSLNGLGRLRAFAIGQSGRFFLCWQALSL